jgi:hypothetical protein
MSLGLCLCLTLCFVMFPCLRCNTHKRHIVVDHVQGVLLVNLPEKEFTSAHDWFQEMEPGFAVSCATDGFLDTPLEEALFDDDRLVCSVGSGYRVLDTH